MGKSAISMAIFHCYVSSPEGKCPNEICRTKIHRFCIGGTPSTEPSTTQETGSHSAPDDRSCGERKNGMSHGGNLQDL